MQSLDPDSAEIASEGIHGARLVQQFVPKPNTHVQMRKHGMERLETCESAVRRREAEHAKVSRTVAAQ